MGIPILDSILGVIKTPLERLIPDKNKRLELEHEIAMSLARANLAQAEINKEEAKHASVFVAGWRPFIGWVCGIALAWHFILFDVFNWVRAVFFPDVPPPPALNGVGELMSLVLAMLGLGMTRTVEKIKGVTTLGVGRKKK